MKNRQVIIGPCLNFLQKHFLWFLIASYGIAAICPSLGLWIRDVKLGEVSVEQQKIHWSLPMLMLSFLLFNAGLGVKSTQLRGLFRNPFVLFSGLTSNLLVPIAFIWCLARLMQHWHDPEEVQVIILGLALVAAMPIAGSSTAWSQNANGDVALSLALMLFSTFLSPFTTPFTFELLERLAYEEYALALYELGTQGTGFLFWVIVPAFAGMVMRRLIGEQKTETIKPILKVMNYVNLLTLNYSNAAVSLPQTVADPDWAFLLMTLIIVVGLCVLTFSSGWIIAQVLRLDHAQKVALMFGLGMSNNGTGLVLASMVLADYPKAMLPLIFYNLVQHLVAGCVDYLLSRSAAENARSLAEAKV